MVHNLLDSAVDHINTSTEIMESEGKKITPLPSHFELQSELERQRKVFKI